MHKSCSKSVEEAGKQSIVNDNADNKMTKN